MPSAIMRSMDAPGGISPKKEGIAKYLVLSGLGCAVLLGFIGAVVYFVFYVVKATSPPVEIVNEQLKAIRGQDLQKAYSFCSEAFKQNTNYKDFQEFVQAYPLLKNSKEFSSNSREIAGSTAKLTGAIRAEDGSSQPAEFHLVKEGADWKVQYIHLTSAEPPAAQNVPREVASSAVVNTPQPKPLHISDVNVQKQSNADLVTITIAFKVRNFAQTDPSSSSARVHLVQDLKTFDPSGNFLQDLSKEGIKELQENGSFEYADFSNTLSIPASYPGGKYTAQLIIHDRLGNTDTESTTEFELP